MSTANDTRLHATVVVEHGGRKVALDAMLAPLIREIWLAGLATIMCCQEIAPGVAWIEFEDFGDFKRFLDLVVVFEDASDAVYDRAVSYFCAPEPEGLWQYTLTPHDEGDADENGGPEGRPTNIVFNAGLQFPQTDLSILLQRLKSHNRNHRPSA